MQFMINHPRILALACFVVMSVLARLGVLLRTRLHATGKADSGNLTLVVSAALTLLGLIIGFTFSMATERYDQRRLFEEEEANAIGTEYVRADLLPPPQAAATRDLLRQYLARRISFYQTSYGSGLDRLNRRTTGLEDQLWQSIQPAAAAAPNPVTALVVSGMNDVLNRQGYTQFAWWNRIPSSAWALMIVIAFFSSALVGFATERSRSASLLLYVLPLLVSVSFFLVSDIDSPRGGMIRIPPVDLISLAQSLGGN